jgi:hypothetical protein
MGQTTMKSFLRTAALMATVLTLAGCAGGWEDETLPSQAGFVAAAPAAKPLQVAAQPSAPAAVKAPRRVTYIVRTAPVLRGVAGSTCPWAQTAQARANAYRPARGQLAALPPRALEHRRTYRFTSY